MEESQVKVFRTIDGQTIISKFKVEQENYILYQPMTLETSSFDGVSLTPLNSMELLENQIKIFKAGIIYIGTPKPFLIDKYVSLTNRKESIGEVEQT